MTFILPSTPKPQSANPRPIDFGGWQQPIAGGTITRLDRPGNRFAVNVTMPRMKPEPTGRLWVSALLRAIGQPVAMIFPQPGLTIGTPGTALTDGAGQTGTTLHLKGMTAGYIIREGQFFSGADFIGAPLFMCTANTTVGSDGRVAVPIWPMIRLSPTDSLPFYFDGVLISGMLSGNENGWTLERAGTRGLEFTITEIK